jgi:hypothetical protein
LMIPQLALPDQERIEGWDSISLVVSPETGRPDSVKKVADFHFGFLGKCGFWGHISFLRLQLMLNAEWKWGHSATRK